MSKTTINQITDSDTQESNWKSLYRLGGVAALSTVLVGLVEIGITFLPGGTTPAETVFDWFKLFQNNSFMALRNLGLLNIFLTALGIPTFFALYGAHRRTSQTFAALAMSISIIGVAVFYATNRAFAMLELSNQYALATTEAQKAMLATAGQALLSVGQSHTPGTFMAFFLSESAGVLMAVVMLRDKLFSKINAYAGIFGFTFLLIFEVITSFVPALRSVAMIFAMVGGILSMVWDILLARKLFQLAK
jgi:hypothetical protein